MKIKKVASAFVRANFAEILLETTGGTTIEITRHGKPIARLVPAEETKKRSRAKGR